MHKCIFWAEGIHKNYPVYEMILTFSTCSVWRELRPEKLRRLCFIKRAPVFY